MERMENSSVQDRNHLVEESNEHSLRIESSELEHLQAMTYLT